MPSPLTSDIDDSESSPNRSFAELINEGQTDPTKKDQVELVRKQFLLVLDNLEQAAVLAPQAGIHTDAVEKAFLHCRKTLTNLNTLASYAEENPNARVDNASFNDVKPKHLDHMGIMAGQVFPGQELKGKLIALLEERGLAEPLGTFGTGSEEVPHIAKRFKYKRHLLIGGLDILFNYVNGLEEACEAMGYTYPFLNVEQDVSIDAQAIITFDNPVTKLTQATFLCDNILVMPVILKQTKKGPVWSKGDTEDEEGDLPKLMTHSQTFKNLIDDNQPFFIFEVGKRRHLADPQDVQISIARCLVLTECRFLTSPAAAGL
ncbi:hypothetical protein CPB83DRAFT_909887 [Crepidotus variabilis]|uniref:Uncharacterized protein n=1 Tax=Crepidotus variabilis TaxID=179855 RepID=A0A9P6E8K8_9AGAR|nr:hypothetical protein CPB83DRAFT_909887 [Crepidotus variabilis]